MLFWFPVYLVVLPRSSWCGEIAFDALASCLQLPQMYMTPELLGATLVGFVLIFGVMVGVCCLQGIQSPRYFPASTKNQ